MQHTTSQLTRNRRKRSGTTYGGHFVKGEFFSNMFTHTYSQSEALTTPVEPTTLDIRRRTTTDTHQIMFAQFPTHNNHNNHNNHNTTQHNTTQQHTHNTTQHTTHNTQHTTQH